MWNAKTMCHIQTIYCLYVAHGYKQDFHSASVNIMMQPVQQEAKYFSVSLGGYERWLQETAGA